MGNLKKKAGKIVWTVLLLVLLVTVVDLQPAQAAVKLNVTSLNLCVGETAKLKLSGTTKKVTWKSSKPKIVKVSSKGSIRALSAGSATITATVSKKKYSCKVKVNKTFKVEATSVSIKNNKDVMAFLSVNGSIHASVADKKICSVTFGAWDGDYMPLTIVPKKVGSTTIKFTNSVNNEYCTLNVKVTALPVIAKFQTPTVNTGANTFVVGENAMSFAFQLNRSAKATYFKFYNADNDVVRVFDLGSVSANRLVHISWDGCDEQGNPQNGTFKYAVVADGTKTSGGTGTVHAVSPFGKGDGTENNPFLVSSLTELRKIKNYNGACFVQDEEIDFNYTAIEPLFDDTTPFTGTYDGKCGEVLYKMVNLYGYNSVFGSIGEQGTVRNVSMSNCVLNTDGGLLADRNQGTIDSCTVSGTVLCNGGIQAALLVMFNEGQIRKCNVSGNLAVVISNVTESTTLKAGGIAVQNTGMIAECTSAVMLSQQMRVGTYVATNLYTIYTGGIVAENTVDGFVTQCMFSGDIDTKITMLNDDTDLMGLDNGKMYSGYIAGNNQGFIGGCVNVSPNKELLAQGSGDGKVQ